MDFSLNQLHLSILPMVWHPGQNITQEPPNIILY
nr:MAG TPA: hypothetical protein [Caudoviricetes sp.]